MKNKTRDLAKALYEQIRSRSPDHAERFSALFINQHPGWTVGPLPTEEQQIDDMSHFWHLQLGMLNVDTMQARSCIISNIEADQWLKNFERYVLNTVLVEVTPSQTWKPQYV